MTLTAVPPPVIVHRFLFCDISLCALICVLRTFTGVRRRPVSQQLVKWLTRQGAACTVGAMDGAAGGGHLDVVRWLATNRLEGCSQAAFDMAAAEGHLHVIKVWKRRPLAYGPHTHERAPWGYVRTRRVVIM